MESAVSDGRALGGNSERINDGNREGAELVIGINGDGVEGDNNELTNAINGESLEEFTLECQRA